MTHPLREGGKELPMRQDLPAMHQQLIDWYLNTYASPPQAQAQDPVLRLRGLGKSIWASECADDFVRRQREA